MTTVTQAVNATGAWRRLTRMLSPQRRARIRRLREHLDSSADAWADAREQLHRELVAAATDPDEDTTQQELAQEAGYTRERISQLLKEARERGQ